MSTTSGFIVGMAVAATLTVVFSGEINGSLEQLTRFDSVSLPAAVMEQETPDPTAQASIDPVDVEPAQLALAPAPTNSAPTTQASLTLEQRWADYAAGASAGDAAGEFPWRACFRRAAAAHTVPETLLLAVASGESNFDPAARSDKDAIGLMQIRWPDTARHLGLRREADLYDPCTNVDAGARYLAELLGRFDNNLHLALAAYNYGPARIVPGAVPEGANWYSQYIYQHLQQVLGSEHIATSKLLTGQSGTGSGQLVLMRFNRPQRARDFIAYLGSEVPGLDLQQRSEALGQHEVVLLYQSATERQRALEALNASGLATINPSSPNKLSL